MTDGHHLPAYPSFDRSHLPPALFEFVVMSDTHFILDPEPYAVEFDSVRQWPLRAEWAIRTVAAMRPDFVIHLGDLTEENHARPQQAESRTGALAQFARHDVRPYHVPGNMDIGDKPDPTMPTKWVTPGSLDKFHTQFGRSWYSFDRHGIHFVVLNSQIMGGPQPEAAEQQAWLEDDLAAHADRRIFLFLHMPPFFVAEDESDVGFYNSLGQPARGWITALLRKHQVELLFAGHTHFRVLNRVGETRLYVAPSTTTSRAGFYEAFSVAPPPEQGRNDRPKLGFYLVRVYGEGARVHFVRTGGQTGPGAHDRGWQRLLCRTSQDLPQSPSGVFLRTPLVQQSAGALAWPSVLRQTVRDDHPLLSILEAGIRHVRAPVSDLDDALQRRRLQQLRDEGAAVTGLWLYSDRPDLIRSIETHVGDMDFVEVQIPGALLPDRQFVEKLAGLAEESAKPVVLAPLFAMERAAGKYHPRTRVGYLPDELALLDRRLAELDVHIGRALCHVGPDASPWDAIRQFGHVLPLDRIGGLDFVVGLAGLDDRTQALRAAEALFAAALQTGCRLFLDPLVDLDRTNDVSHGLLDRLSNPRPAYYAVQSLNTVLFGDPQTYTAIQKERAGRERILGLSAPDRRHYLILPPDDGYDPVSLDGLEGAAQLAVVDLTRGFRQTFTDVNHVQDTLVGINLPVLVSTSQRSIA